MKRLLILLLLCSSVGSTVSAKRLYTNGCESHKQFTGGGTNGFMGEFGGWTAVVSTSVGGTNPVHADTATKYSGDASTNFEQAGCGSGFGVSWGWVYQSIGTATGATFTRAKWRFTGFPDPHSSFCSANVLTFETVKNSTDSVNVKVDSSGRISLWLNNSQLARTANSISTNTWYIYQLKVDFRTVGASYSLRVSAPAGGASETLSDTTAANGTAVPIQWEFGIINHTSSGASLNLDDVAVNDQTGSFENSYPSDSGKVMFLYPKADSARGGWVAGGNSTTNLWDGLDWNPGIVFKCSYNIDTNAILSRGTNANDNVFLSVQSYTERGIVSPNQVLMVQAEVYAGDSVGGADKEGALLVSSNPAQASEVSFVFGGGIKGGPCNDGPSEPDRHFRYAESDPSYLPAIVYGTRPVIMIGRRTSTSDTLPVMQAYLMAEYSLIQVIGQDAQVITY